MSIKKQYILALMTALLMVCLAVPAAWAQVDIIPASKAESEGLAYDESLETHPVLRLTPDKSEIIRLDTEAGSVIVGNPVHLNIFADSPTTLIAVPRLPGASHFSVLDKRGNIIMQRHVIVASPKEKYVRVRQTCYGEYTEEEGCIPVQTLYCPDMCHEIAGDYGQEEGRRENPEANGGGGNGNGETASTENEESEN